MPELGPPEDGGGRARLSPGQLLERKSAGPGAAPRAEGEVARLGPRVLRRVRLRRAQADADRQGP